VLARKEKLPVSGMFGVYVLERLFDTASAAVIAAVALLLFRSHTHAGRPLAGSRRGEDDRVIALRRVIGAVAFLVYLRLHGTALLERQLQGWLKAHGWRGNVAGILLGFARGVQTIRTWSDLALTTFYSMAHWFLVLLVYLWCRTVRGTLGTISLGDAMLVMAFTLVGSAVQLPGVGGGSQVASFLAYTTIFGVEKEPAAAASIVMWLITFAASSLAGVPLLIHEGFSLGNCARWPSTKRSSGESAAQQGESPR